MMYGAVHAIDYSGVKCRWKWNAGAGTGGMVPVQKYRLGEIGALFSRGDAALLFGNVQW
jgi:surface antigen